MKTVSAVFMVALAAACEPSARDPGADSAADNPVHTTSGMSRLESLAGHKLGIVSFADDFVELHFEPPDDPSAITIDLSVGDANQAAAEDDASMPDDRPNALWAGIRAYANPSITLEGRVAQYPDPLAREALYSLVGRLVKEVIEGKRDSLELVLTGDARIRVPLRSAAKSPRPAAHFRQHGVTQIFR